MEMLRVKIGLAVAIIKACPVGTTPEMYASLLCSKRYCDINTAMERETNLRKENHRLRQRLLVGKLETDGSPAKKRAHKRKSEISVNFTSMVHSEDLHGGMSSKMESQCFHDLNDSFYPGIIYTTEPIMAFHFLKVFLSLEDTIDDSIVQANLSNDKKIMITVQAIDFLIGELFWTDVNSYQKSATGMYSLLSLDSFNKVAKIVASAVEMLILITSDPSSPHICDTLDGMLERTIEKMKLFVWNYIKHSDFDLVNTSWKGVLDRLVSISKCSSTMKHCICNALTGVISMVTHLMKNTSSTELDAHNFLDPHIMENSAKAFLCIEEISSQTLHLNCKSQTKLIGQIRNDSKKLLNHSLLYLSETHPLYTLRIWTTVILL